MQRLPWHAHAVNAMQHWALQTAGTPVRRVTPFRAHLTATTGDRQPSRAATAAGPAGSAASRHMTALWCRWPMVATTAAAAAGEAAPSRRASSCSSVTPCDPCAAGALDAAPSAASAAAMLLLAPTGMRGRSLLPLLPTELLLGSAALPAALPGLLLLPPRLLAVVGRCSRVVRRLPPAGPRALAGLLLLLLLHGWGVAGLYLSSRAVGSTPDACHHARPRLLLLLAWPDAGGSAAAAANAVPPAEQAETPACCLGARVPPGRNSARSSITRLHAASNGLQVVRGCHSNHAGCAGGRSRTCRTRAAAHAALPAAPSAAAVTRGSCRVAAPAHRRARRTAQRL